MKGGEYMITIYVSMHMSDDEIGYMLYTYSCMHNVSIEDIVVKYY